MKSTQIIPHLVGNWHKGVPCFCGTIFDGMKMLLPKETQEIISNLKGESAILNFLKGANGFFSIINIDDNTGWMAVDRIRSMPIFTVNITGNFSSAAMQGGCVNRCRITK